MTKILFPNFENHNSYLFLGNTELILKSLLSDLERLNYHLGQDIILFDRPKFLIEDSRKVIDIFAKKNTQKEFFILTLDSITIEAQNALLKTIESLNSKKFFFIIANSSVNFLPTLKSRFIIKEFNFDTSYSEKEIEDFLNLNSDARIKFLSEKFFDQEKIINKFQFYLFIDRIIEFIFNKSLGTTSEYLEILKKKEQIFFISSNQKNLIEFFSLILPKNSK